MKSLGEKDACNDSLPNFYVPNKQLITYLKFKIDTLDS